MPDTAAPMPFQTRRLPPGVAPIDGGTRGAGTRDQPDRRTGHAPGARHPPERHSQILRRPTCRLRRDPRLLGNREAAVLARATPAAPPTGGIFAGSTAQRFATSTEDTIVCQLCELLWADHACLWMLPTQPDEAHDWSRQTIVSEAVAEYYPLVGYSTCTPTAGMVARVPGAVAASRGGRAAFRPAVQHAQGGRPRFHRVFTLPDDHLPRAGPGIQLAVAARTLRRVGRPGDAVDRFRPRVARRHVRRPGDGAGEQPPERAERPSAPAT